MKRLTEGTWTVQKSDHPDSGLLIKAIPGQVIAECDQLPEMEANAQLLSASKELLTALQGAHRFLRKNGYDMEQIDAAISKAVD